ncbi:DUF1799 domain-containing protein [Chitinibacter sp. GC72]|uniref:DUF1799 domain-containing protein n=1 Tax=Chitinibacter sp. GC72 TaxID=1526917 RepID=UPI0012F7290F|nr:DUF1799 domain-containing protein [Chitinibacter sp. GC72]
MGITLPADWQQEDEYELWPEHLAVFYLFLDCQTQWRVLPSGHFQGFDYLAVESVMRMQRIKPADRAALLADLRVMEQAALDIWAEED